MMLCFDIGNSHICGGVFVDSNLLIQFRYDSRRFPTSDEFGVFIRSVLRENDIDYKNLTKVGIASVVPSLDYSIRSACIKYLHLEPLFLRPGTNTGVEIKVHEPTELGADLIAGGMAAKTLYPNQDLLIFDLGTATTCIYLNANGEILGGAISPGILLMMESLQNNTARLFGVNITTPRQCIGRNTREAIQSGIYYAQFGLMRQLIQHTIKEYELVKTPLTIGTGGFSHLFASEKLFDHLVPELVLLGVRQMLDLN